MTKPLCAMLVHAHPDDEVIPTGGLIARCADEGITTILVTCTDGSQGFGPDFVNSGEPGHSPDLVASVRRRELEVSCEALGVTHLELLGYSDSGMEGWEANRNPNAFCRADLMEAAERLSTLIQQYQPDVLITYANNGGSGHPDHVNAHLITLLADDLTGIARKLYFVVRSESFNDRVRLARESLQLDLRRPESGLRGARPNTDHLITTVIDTRSTVARKRKAMYAHLSQLRGSHWLQLDDASLRDIFATETYIRVRDKTRAAIPEDDIFAGLRDQMRDQVDA
ncbi:MAG TPA: PIG-L family deacetylase [Acidimicrobiales bacterium]|nr:PIG-L family deacetylase [Acidimicrobiales bacterium]